MDEDYPDGVFTAAEADESVHAAHPHRGQRLAELGIVDAYRKASREPPEGCVWVCMSEGDGRDIKFRIGDCVELGEREVVVRHRAIHQTPAGGQIFCEAMAVVEVELVRGKLAVSLRGDFDRGSTPSWRGQAGEDEAEEEE